ncbi:hypothetical protein JR316_0000164 [Psilocybe cubensis]|uniref:Uncharacterized protein n=2 Tax=Psilocybe cubensis TaxID=181762 RepID=A0ACB8HDK5_PSICU|nr:hypothetical protein JR316_0000164 [Psilocybe cubensis]KAH9486100.1 hypothetical protein JR316_0000164 [Psilocybe cubensis]
MAIEASSKTAQKWHTTPTTVTTAITIGLAIFFIFDIMAFVYIIMILKETSRIGAVDSLPFKNPYVGLDQLYNLHKIKPSQYDRIVNEPRLATQISQDEPQKIFPVDLHRWLSDFGLLSPPDRNFKVTSTIHTILQFHVLDYGMEQCSLAVRLPNREDILPHPFSLPVTGDTVRLDICELAASRPLKESTLSWSTRPNCIRSLGSLDAKIGGEVSMEPFFCRSGSFIAYQVSCAKGFPGCEVDVWTNQNATWGELYCLSPYCFRSPDCITTFKGVYLNQYQTT